jgi:cytochrome c peroxidase
MTPAARACRRDNSRYNVACRRLENKEEEKPPMRLGPFNAVLGLCMTLMVFAGVSYAASPESTSSQDSSLAKGYALFNDKSLSGDSQWSCASCHPAFGHTDNKTYVGVEVVANGDSKGRSTPTLWGAGTRKTFSWAGTAPSLEANIKGIIVNRMKGAEPSKETLDALFTYVKSLSYPPNPFLKPDGTLSDAVPAAAKRGYQLFGGKAGCQTCHLAPTYDKEGVEDVSSGGTFKIPSLRAVSQTAPYFHDGRYKTLEESVRAMWEYVQKAGTSEQLTDADIKDLVEFLLIL